MKKLLLLLVAALRVFGGDAVYDNLTLGIPGKADTIIDREGYALGYSELHEQPAWVIYKLTAEEVLNKVAKRSSQFKPDPEIPTGSATLADYRNSGYDRGHLAPAADMAWSEKAMSDSFYMSNMSPQRPAFNRGIGAKLEAQVRVFAVVEKEIYVVTGAILPNEPTSTIGANRVTVPTHYYKVIYGLTPPCKMIAFILTNAGSDRPLQSFAVTVDAVETATGLDFFPRVPTDEQEKLESSLTIDAWNWSDPYGFLNEKSFGKPYKHGHRSPPRNPRFSGSCFRDNGYFLGVGDVATPGRSLISAEKYDRNVPP